MMLYRVRRDCSASIIVTRLCANHLDKMLFDPNSALAGSSGNASSSLYRSMEFIAVILAGEGSATSRGSASLGLEAGGDGNADDEAESSKAAIQPPILQRAEDGKPQIDSVLKWIEEAGVTGVSASSPLLLKFRVPTLSDPTQSARRRRHSGARVSASGPHFLPSDTQEQWAERYSARRDHRGASAAHAPRRPADMGRRRRHRDGGAAQMGREESVQGEEWSPHVRYPPLC